MKAPWIAMASALLALTSCGGAEVFACSDDSSCPSGQCESNGYCSFPAEDCASGWRYGQFSGPFSGQCVMPTDAATSGTPGSSGGSGANTSASTTGPSATDSAPGPTSASSMDTDAEDTGDTGSSSDCGNGGTCFDVPDGWSGPVRLQTGAESCADVVAEGALSHAGGWDCACSCDAEVLDTCEGASIELQLFEQDDCRGPVALSVELTSSCQDFGEGNLYSILATGEGDAACTSDPMLDASPITAVDPRVLCGVREGATCTGGTCVSDPAGLCIHAEGEHDCPAGLERTMLYGAFEDGRACSDCGCEAEFECTGSYTLANQGCGQAGSLTLETGCSNFLTSVLGGFEGSLDGPVMLTECSTDGGEPLGDVVSTEPRTVCCAL